MTEDTNEQPGRKRVFISYSWSSNDWTLTFAQKLRAEYGIDVIIDRWNLKDGEDLVKFMEREVNDPSIDKVLMICDKQYMEKANKRTHGAGTEAQILSPAIYKDQEPTKFIPIVINLDATGEPYLPTFLTSRLYVDFSNPVQEVANYHHLIKTIYDRGDIAKPDLGPVPTKIINDQDSDYPLRNSVLTIQGNIERPRLIVHTFQKDYLNRLYASLTKCTSDLEDSYSNQQIDHECRSAIAKFDDNEKSFQDCLDTYIAAEPKDLDALAQYFNKLYTFVARNGLDCDPIRFLLNEQFLMTVATLIQQRSWKLMHYLLNYNYRESTQKRDFTCMLPYVKSLNYNFVDSLQPIPSAMLMAKRNKEDLSALLSADVVLTYVSHLMHEYHSEPYQYDWFPQLQKRTAWPQIPLISLLDNLGLSENMDAICIVTGFDWNFIVASDTFNKPVPGQPGSTNTILPAMKDYSKSVGGL